MNVLIKSTNIFVTSLLLFTTALLIGAVSNESVNKDKLTNGTAAAAALPALPAHTAIDHSDLPTRFGDEDDVIERKASADKKEHDSLGGKSGKPSDKYDRHGYGYDSDEDEYDDEDGTLSGAHLSGKDRSHDDDVSDPNYDDESELGPTLDNFGAKLDGIETGNELPVLLVEPQSTYVVRNRPAILKCKAAHSLQVNTTLVHSIETVPGPGKRKADGNERRGRWNVFAMKISMALNPGNLFFLSSVLFLRAEHLEADRPIVEMAVVAAECSALQK